MAFVSIALTSWILPGVLFAQYLFRHLSAMGDTEFGANPSQLYENGFQRTMLVKKIGYLTKNERSLVFESTLQKNSID